ncbi:hypothetical protein TNCV_4111061 [Trichonephila clavipes]|nr:hypothetical protein TNCV_4111061 [Trichonephila clavipes]
MNRIQCERITKGELECGGFLQGECPRKTKLEQQTPEQKLEERSTHYDRRLTHIIQYLQFDSGSNDSSGIDDDNLRDSVESDQRVSFVNNGLVGPYSVTVLVTLSSAPDNRPPRLASAR